MERLRLGCVRGGPLYPAVAQVNRSRQIRHRATGTFPERGTSAAPATGPSHGGHHIARAHRIAGGGHARGHAPARAPGPLSEALVHDLATRTTLSAATIERADRVGAAGRRRLTDEDLQISLASATSCTTAASTASPTTGSGTRRCSGCARGLERRHLAALRGLVGPIAGDRRADRPAADRRDRRRRRAVAVVLHGQAGHPRAVAGVPHAALGVPPQGGRPAQLRHPAAVRPGQVGDGGDPGRRVRRRGARADAQHAVRRADARPRPRPRLRRALGRGPGGGLRVGQHDVAVRAAPALARRPRSATWPRWR